MWSNRNVWIVLAGEFVAGLGMWTSIIANLEFMQQQVPSDFMKSLVLFTGLLAGVIMAPYAGKVVDMYPKKKVLVYSGIGRLFSVCFMFVAIANDSIFWMIVFVIALQVSLSFMFPALQALIPRIVPSEQLISLNGVFMNASTIARIIGTSLAGTLLVVMSISILYVASFVAYALLLLSTLLLRVNEKEQKPQLKQKEKASFKEMIPMLKSMPIAVMMLVLSVIPALFIGSFNLMVINISELQGSAQIKGYLYTVEGVCFILAAFLVKRIAGQGSLLKKLFFFGFLIAISQLSLFFADVPLVSILAFGLFGFAAGCFFPLIATFFQTNIPQEMHGRFFSFRGMLDRVLMQVVLLSTGLLLDTIGLQYMVLVFGAMSILFLVNAIAYARRNGVREQNQDQGTTASVSS
ncbi:MFS transporter [Paenibacillus marinisediminis]